MRGLEGIGVSRVGAEEVSSPLEWRKYRGTCHPEKGCFGMLRRLRRLELGMATENIECVTFDKAFPVDRFDQRKGGNGCDRILIPAERARFGTGNR